MFSCNDFNTHRTRRWQQATEICRHVCWHRPSTGLPSRSWVPTLSFRNWPHRWEPTQLHSFKMGEESSVCWRSQRCLPWLQGICCHHPRTSTFEEPPECVGMHTIKHPRVETSDHTFPTFPKRILTQTRKTLFKSIMESENITKKGWQRREILCVPPE